MIFNAQDNKEIFVSAWETVTEPVGVVQISHGMAEHTGRYEEFAAYLNGLGYVVYADDHRGHGQTDKDTLGYAKGDMFGDTVKDIVGIGKTLREKYPDKKLVLLGHSYGSFLTQKVMAEAPDLYDGFILYGSNYKKDFETRFGALVASIGCAIRGESTPSNFINSLTFGAYAKKFDDRLWLSADPAYSSLYDGDPLCGFVCSYNFYRSFMKGLNSLYTKEYGEKLNKNTPVLLISGRDDPVGAMGKGVEKLYSYYRSLGVKAELCLIDGARHVLLGEREESKKIFIDRVTEFLQKA